MPSIVAEFSLGTTKITTIFFALSEEENTKTLFGADFLEDLGLVVDLPQKTFCFLDRPLQHFQLIQKDDVQKHIQNDVQVNTVTAEQQLPPPPAMKEDRNYGSLISKTRAFKTPKDRTSTWSPGL